MRTGPDRKREQFDQVGIGGRCVWIRYRERFALLQMQLRDILESTGNHEARVGKVEALANGAGKVEDFGHYHAVVAARQKVGYMVAQHLFQNSAF